MKHTKWMGMLGLILVLVLALGAVGFAQGETVMVSDNAAMGPILTDANGMTLYIFTVDDPNVSNCYDQCATNWPPLTVAAGETPTGGAGVTGALGVTERTDGTFQVTYDGMPLYHFFKDTAPGDTTGDGVKGVWFVVHPAEAMAMAAPTALPVTGGTALPITTTVLVLAGLTLLLTGGWVMRKSMQ